MRALLFITATLVLCQRLDAGLLPDIFPDVQKVTDLLSTTKNVTTGIITSIPDAIPRPSDLLNAGKQLLLGLPFTTAMSLVNQICSTALASDVIQPRVDPDINNMSFLLITHEKNYSFPLLDADQMWTHPAFHKDRKTVLFITGWMTDLSESSTTIDTMAKAHLCRGDINFVVLDSARYIDTFYTWSAFNTEVIGEHVAKGLVELSKNYNLENIHLVGHSLGAHICGQTGRSLTDLTGQVLPRITGLDPANPCFNEGEALSGLMRGDAKFVDIIHSNPGGLGKYDPLGDVDTYPAGTNALPPGCTSISCAHERSWHYYAESVFPGNENNFMSTRCTSLQKLKQGKCPGKQVPMGFAMPTNLKGNYFLTVNAKSPYGMYATTAGIHCRTPK